MNRFHALRRYVPRSVKTFMLRLYWLGYDSRDYLAELLGLIPSHSVRLIGYKYLFGITIGRKTSIHSHCRFYKPSGVEIGHNTIINRDVLLDGRSGLNIGNNVSVSEGALLLSLEHDPNSPSFANRGGPVTIHDYVFIGARAIILPSVSIGNGVVVAAGAVVTRDVEAFTIVGGVPARVIGQRNTDLTYQLNYRKFLG